MPVSGERLQVLATNYMNEDPIEVLSSCVTCRETALLHRGHNVSLNASDVQNCSASGDVCILQIFMPAGNYHVA